MHSVLSRKPPKLKDFLLSHQSLPVQVAGIFLGGKPFPTAFQVAKFHFYHFKHGLRPHGALGSLAGVLAIHVGLVRSVFPNCGCSLRLL